jgi:glucose/arabinose dehydrogenase
MTRIRGILSIVLAGMFFGAAAAPAQLATDRITAGLTKPTYLTGVPGDRHRLFVLQQAGLIRIVKDGVLLQRPFLDIVDVVNDQDNEQGLLGMAFHPDFENNGWFYVYFTGGTNAGNSQIRRYTVTSDPDSADVSTSFRVFQVAQPAGQGNHKGGQIMFGDDGYLYLGLGDGGGAGDQGNRAQTGTTLLGKMLRLNVVGDAYPADPNNNYSIPPDNPFVDDPDVLDEIWALGMRNPYRWSFDRETFDMYIGDVGQGLWEEIDFEPSDDPGGHNYGWRLMEGNHCFNPPTNCDDGDPVLTYPIHEYPHDPPPPGGQIFCSVTAGFVYRGSLLPGAIQGHFFFADYCADAIWSFKVVGGAVTEFTEWTNALHTSVDNFTVSDIVAICEDGLGELYIVDRQGSQANLGEIYKIVGNVGNGVDLTDLPIDSALELSRVVPNPFRSQASFDVKLISAGDVSIGIYDTAGRLVRTIHDGALSAGRHSFVWDGRRGAASPAAAGVYFVRAEGLGVHTTQRVALVR